MRMNLNAWNQMKRAALGLILLGIAMPAHSQEAPATDIRTQMAITQNLGGSVPSDTAFFDETGKAVTLGDYLGKRPVVLVPLSLKCQSGCAVILDSLIKILAKASHPSGIVGMMTKGQDQRLLKLGRDLDVVLLSIDPEETPVDAAAKKKLVTDAFNQPGTEANWHLLTGKLENIRKVTDAIGFKFYFDPTQHILRNPTGSVVLTPDGHISAYTIGTDVLTTVLDRELRLAATNKIGDRVDQSTMFGCIQLDPAAGRHRDSIENFLRLLCVVTIFVVGGWISGMLLKERRQKLDRGGQPSGA